MMDPARIPQGADPIPSTACVDAKRLWRSAMPSDTVSRVLDVDNTSSSSVLVSPLDDQDLLQEILLRLPPQPSSLPRASLVCTRWRSLLSDQQFFSRFRKHHRKPPLLGFFLEGIDSFTEIAFAAVLDSPNPIPAARFSLLKSHKDWNFMGCRHGLAVLINECRRKVVVWDPLTGQHQHVTFPPGFDNNWGRDWRWYAAVLCADVEDGHVHGDCFSSPFKVVLICDGHRQTSACLYESASGVWGNIVSTTTTNMVLSLRPSVLIGNALYWLFRGGHILVFDIERQTLGVIEKPADAHRTDLCCFQLLRTDDDSGLGLAVMLKLSIQLWEKKSNCDGVVGWLLLQKTIQLDGLFSCGMRSFHKGVMMVGYDEDSNEIVLATYIGDFMLNLESMRFRTISKSRHWLQKFLYCRQGSWVEMVGSGTVST